MLHQGSEDVSEIVKEEEKVQHLLLPAADTFFKVRFLFYFLYL